MAGKEKASRKVKKALDSKERIDLCLSEIRKMKCEMTFVTCGLPVCDHDFVSVNIVCLDKKTNTVFSSLQLGEYDFASRRDKLLVRGQKKIVEFVCGLPDGIGAYNIKVTGEPEKLIVKVEEFLRTLNTK